MTKTEAIMYSLDKWNAICDSKKYVKAAVGICPLCRKHMNFTKNGPPACRACPLHCAGLGCLDKGSVWKSICAIVRLRAAVGPQAFLKTLDIPELTSLCCQMRDTLQDLYDKETG